MNLVIVFFNITLHCSQFDEFHLFSNVRSVQNHLDEILYKLVRLVQQLQGCSILRYFSVLLNAFIRPAGFQFTSVSLERFGTASFDCSEVLSH